MTINVSQGNFVVNFIVINGCLLPTMLIQTLKNKPNKFILTRFYVLKHICLNIYLVLGYLINYWSYFKDNISKTKV